MAHLAAWLGDEVREHHRGNPRPSRSIHRGTRCRSAPRSSRDTFELPAAAIEDRHPRRSRTPTGGHREICRRRHRVRHARAAISTAHDGGSVPQPATTTSASTILMASAPVTNLFRIRSTDLESTPTAASTVLPNDGERVGGDRYRRPHHRPTARRVDLQARRSRCRPRRRRRSRPALERLADRQRRTWWFGFVLATIGVRRSDRAPEDV